jgi:glutaminyl-tRNA synthetase
MVAESPAPSERRDFIREIVAGRHRRRPRRDARHPLPARAQRLPPHRPCQVDLPELRDRAEFGGRCNLRFDDTNPVKEEQEYIDAIEADVRWLGFDWGDACSTRPTTSTSSTPGPST